MGWNVAFHPPSPAAAMRTTTRRLCSPTVPCQSPSMLCDLSGHAPITDSMLPLLLTMTFDTNRPWEVPSQHQLPLQNNRVKKRVEYAYNAPMDCGRRDRNCGHSAN